MTPETKAKIKNYIDAYRTVSPFKEEYQRFLNGNRAELDSKEADFKYMEVKGMQSDMRLRRELPETLYMILLKQLSEAEFEWFNSREGIEWFAKHYKEFSVGNG